MSKKLLFIGVMVLSLLATMGAALGSAADLKVQGGTIQTGTIHVLECDEDGVWVSDWGLNLNTGRVNCVTLEGIEAENVGNNIKIDITGKEHEVIATSGWIEITGSVMNISFTPAVGACAIYDFHVYIEGLDVPCPPPDDGGGDDDENGGDDDENGEPEGKSHGYWKAHEEDWREFTPGQTLEDVFNIPGNIGIEGNTTLSSALGFGGGSGVTGGAQILLRDAIAALLNAAHPDINYPLSVVDVIFQVNTALASGNRDTMLALQVVLNGYNNLGADI